MTRPHQDIVTKARRTAHHAIIYTNGNETWSQAESAASCPGGGTREEQIPRQRYTIYSGYSRTGRDRARPTYRTGVGGMQQSHNFHEQLGGHTSSHELKNHIWPAWHTTSHRGDMQSKEGRHHAYYTIDTIVRWHRRKSGRRSHGQESC
jgi:hypothetical protein